jgi:hypothetical protein
LTLGWQGKWSSTVPLPLALNIKHFTVSIDIDQMPCQQAFFNHYLKILDKFDKYDFFTTLMRFEPFHPVIKATVVETSTLASTRQ